MSRGPGRMQREVLAILREQTASLKHTWSWSDDPAEAWRWAGLRRIASKIRGCGTDDLDPELLAADHSLVESVRRAIKTLEQRGLVETAYIWYDARRGDWSDKFLAEYEGSVLHCRLSAGEHAAVRCDKCIGPCPRHHVRYLLGDWRSTCPSAQGLSVDGTVNTYEAAP